jgi:hypothetical protein
MNENPWHIDDIARMQWERIQEEMREIRMAEVANRPHARRLNLAARLAAQLHAASRKWLHAARKTAPQGAPAAAATPGTTINML